MSFRRALLAAFILFLAACATTTTTTAPAPAPARTEARALAPLSGAAPQIAAPRIRVGLETDVPSATFPRIDGGYVIVADGGAFSTRRGFEVTAPASGRPVRWTVRVATFGERVAAQSEAARLGAMTSEPVEIAQDGAGAWRVLVGNFESEAAGAPVRDALLLRGYKPPLFVVRRPAAEPFASELALVDDEGNRERIAGRSILVLPATGETVPIGASRYRGGARLFINDRGLLNLISELNLDDYVRGVVPAELGPRTYDELEAQKAQAIAARTYAVRRLGEYEAEGYDQCPTAACQVYRGFTIEEELSNKAVDETRGLIMTYGGAPIDALFTSTCGGETSDVSTMFQGRDDPYLQGVDCVELAMTPLAGRRDGAAMTGETVALAAIYAALAGLPTHTGALGRDAVAAVEAANRIGGWTPPSTPAPPASYRRGAVIDFLARNWGFSALGAALTLPEDRRYFFEDRAPDDARTAAQAFLIKYGLDPAQAAKGPALDEPMPREELYALLLSWLLETGALQDVQGRLMA
ncbi:MAG TPA: SpoIID/LytB domain-containing protein, partial [Thermoanaerobaculia bacterium]